MSYQGDGFQFKHDPVFVYDEADPRTYEAQWEAWQICRDTLTGDITSYPGTASEQGNQTPVYKAVTKRRR